MKSAMNYGAFNGGGNRGGFYDMRNLPFGYYGAHPMEVLEYQRGRPAKLSVRTLNRQFKRTAIQQLVVEENESGRPPKLTLVISVQMMTAKGKQQQQQQQTQQQQQAFLVLANNAAGEGEVVEEAGDATEVNTADSVVAVPESLAPQLVQQLLRLTKWKPGSSRSQPSTRQGLIYRDMVFKAQIVQCPDSEGQFAIVVLAESRAKDPQERRELASVQIPMEPGVLAQLKTALTDLLVVDSPLYHTEALQLTDGSKLYLDLIKEEAAAHYLKVSHVTRDFRSIVIVPAEDVKAMRDVLSASLAAMKSMQSPDEAAKNGKQRQQQQLQQKRGGAGGAGGTGSGGGRKNQRRRPAGQKRRDGGGGGGSKENGSESTTPSDAEKQPEPQQPQAAQHAESSEDNSTVESKPVEPNTEKLSASE